MKKFDLKAALNGEPVMLRDGRKALIYYRIHDKYTFADGSKALCPLKGIVFDKDGNIESAVQSWRDGGMYEANKSVHDIIGMWEEPKISIEDLPKPFYPEESDDYFYILDGKVAYNSNYYKNNLISQQRAINAQCFRTKQDAQKWLDFMKSMME